MRFTLLLLVAVAGSAVAVADKTSTNDENSIKEIENQMLSSLLKGDPSAFEKYLADTYVFTDQHGMLTGKQDLVRDLKSGDLKFQSSTLEDMKVQVYGDAAVVTYASTDKGTYKGNDISGRTRWTDVFIRRSGQWQEIASHGSSIAKQ